MQTFERLESAVRSYCRRFPVVFTHARGARLVAEDGREYLDFFSGAGALNYGHDEPRCRAALIAYLQAGGVLHSLDMATAAKRSFLAAFHEVILAPRGLDYKVQFTGPTGTNTVEAALKLARKVTGRQKVVAFTNGYHGMTLGALAVTGSGYHRAAAGVPLEHTVFLPFDGYLGPGCDTLQYLERLLGDASSGLDRPAAVIVETVQAEGGVRVASWPWLRRLAELARAHGILLIADDVQAGCGRTGPFFSFEPAGIRPDLVCLSKSISGCGLPMALLLIRPELDVWQPGEHNGTFRGNNLAFVAATAALSYWQDDQLQRAVAIKAEYVEQRLQQLHQRHPETCAAPRGRGLLQGLPCHRPEVAAEVSRRAFEHGLVIETAGPNDEVLKLLPPLVIAQEELAAGLDLLERSFAAVCA